MRARVTPTSQARVYTSAGYATEQKQLVRSPLSVDISFILQILVSRTKENCRNTASGLACTHVGRRVLGYCFSKRKNILDKNISHPALHPPQVNPRSLLTGWARGRFFKTAAIFPLGEFVRANKQKANVIGW